MPVAPSLEKYLTAVTGVSVAVDGELNSVSTTSTVSTSTTGVIGRSTGTGFRRMVHGFSIANRAGTIANFKFTKSLTNVGSACTGFKSQFWAVTPQAGPITEGSAGSGMTYATYNGVDSWSSGGAATDGSYSNPGHGAGTEYAEFNMVDYDSGAFVTGPYTFTDVVAGSNRNPVAGSLDAVINEAVQLAMAAGSTVAYFLEVHSDETNDLTTTARQNVWATHESLTPPEIVYDLYPAPLDGLIAESDASLGFAGGSTCDMTVVIGDAFTLDTGDELWVESGTQAQFDADSGYAATSHVDISAAASPDVVVVPMPTGSASAPLHRLCASVAGVTYKGPLETTPMVPALGDVQVDIYRGDSHELPAINVAITSIYGAGERLQVQAATDANINARLDSLGTAVRSLRCHDGAWMFGQLTSPSNKVFPLATDGTMLAGGSPTSHYALSQDDADECCRAHRVRTPLKLRRAFQEYIHSNHDPYHKQFRTGNNSEANDAEGWAMAAKGAHRVIPVGLDTSTPVRAYRGESIGRWFARPWGNYLHCVLNPGCESLYGSTNTVTVPSPISGTMEDVDDWTLGTAQFDFFFDPTTGVIKEYENVLPWVVIDTHNITGGVPGGATTQVNYGRFGPLHQGTGEWWDIVHPALVSLCAGRCIVILAHDHNWDYEYIDGILYVWVPTPGEIGKNDTATGPYGNGFTGDIGGSIHGDSPHLKPNAGWVELHTSPTRIEVRYYATVTDTSPISYLAAAHGWSDDLLVESVGWPLASGGMGDHRRGGIGDHRRGVTGDENTSGNSRRWKSLVRAGLQRMSSVLRAAGILD